MNIYKNLFSSSIALAFLLVGPQGWTQEGATVEGDASDDVTPIDEVTVFGIRNSLRDAIDIKRSHTGVVDAISADDFGKFPDGNLAESLARVPGIAIDRSNVEGQKIAVRGFGPEFNLVTLNGRQMPTAPGLWVGGRSFNFGDIASPGISAVEVYKSGDITFPSGGIGATVNMVTTKPLNIDDTILNASLTLVEDSTSAVGGTPFETAMLWATKGDRWGFSFSGSYQERSNREEGTAESNWVVPEIVALSEGYLRVDSSNPAYTNNNTRADGYTFYQEPTKFQYKDLDRVRTNGQATFQYAFSDAVTATVDYTFSNVDIEAEGMRFGSWLGGWVTNEATINENGAYTDVQVGERGYDHEVLWGGSENTNKSIGLNLDWIVSDSLAFEFDAHDSSAQIDGPELDNEVRLTTDLQGVVSHLNGGRSGIQSFSYDVDFLPQNLLATSAVVRDALKKNEMKQVQIKGEWTNTGDGIVSSIDFGISHIDSAFTDRRMESNFGTVGATPDAYDDALFLRTSVGGLMSGFSPTIGTDYYYLVDPRDAMTAFDAANPGVMDIDGTVCCGAGGIDSNERVNETLKSAYIQLNMQIEVGNMPLDIVAGLRYEDSETESISFYPAATNLRWDMIDGLVPIPNPDGAVDSPRHGENSLVLPSLALSLGITDNQVIRFAAGITMARPDLFDLSSRLDIGNRDFFNLTASGGNPDLDPLKSKNLDLAYENYYSEGSYFAVNYFYKEVEDFIGTQVTTGESINGMTNPALSALAVAARDCVQEWVDAGRPDPGVPGDEGATGHCVSQQALWAQPWMNDQHHMGWVALGLAAGVDIADGYPWSDGGADDGICQSDGWWRCEPGYLDGTAGDPVASFEVSTPYNMNTGSVSGFEIALQHLFADSPFGFQLNFTKVSGGDVDVDKSEIGEQFILPGFGDSGNFSVFYEDDRHTARIAYNYRGETIVGFANYDQPLFVEERNQIDLSYQFRYNESMTFFLDAANINDETTRLFVRHEEMLFLSQDHGPVYKFGVRANF